MYFGNWKHFQHSPRRETCESTAGNVDGNRLMLLFFSAAGSMDAAFLPARSGDEGGATAGQKKQLRVVRCPSCSPGRFCFIRCFRLLFLVLCHMAAQLFRASLRSVADPLRDHVCISCRARRIGAPSRLRQFHWTPAVRDEHPDSNSGGQMKDVPASSSEIPRGNGQSHKV